MSDYNPKSCPNLACERDDSYITSLGMSGVFFRRCAPCGMTGPLSGTEAEADRQWDALPRCEDFYSVLIEVATWADEKSREGGFEMPGYGDGHAAAYCTVEDVILEVAQKYEPHHPGGDRDND